MDNQNRRADDRLAPGQLQWGESAGAVKSAPMTTDEAREYLVGFMEQHFTDKTFHRYIRGQIGGSGPLAGDFAWQMARALRMLGAPASADNPSTAGAADPVVMECVKAAAAGYGERGYDGETLYCIDCQTSQADGDEHTPECLVTRARAYLAAPVAQSTAGAARLDDLEVWTGQEIMESPAMDGAGFYLASDVADLLAAPALNPSDVRDQALTDVGEGIEILDNLIDSIERHGNYSQDATINFLNQALQCFRAIRALRTASEGNQAAAKGDAL